MAIVAAGIVTGYDWTVDRRFQVRLDLYSHTSEHSASGVLTPETFSVEDSADFVNASIHAFVRDYITGSADAGGWEMVLAADDTIEIINQYQKATAAVELSSKFTAYWNMTEDTGTVRDDAIGSNIWFDLAEIGTVAREATADGSWAALFDGVGGGWFMVPFASRPFGDFDFAFTLWAKYTDHAADAPLFMVFDGSGPGVIFELVRRNDTGMLECRSYNGVSLDAYTSTFNIDESGSVWNFIALWYEAATDTVSLQVNSATAQTFVLTTPIQSVSSPQGYVGFDGTAYFKGAIRRLGFGPFNPTAAERAILFNNGQGQDWPFEEEPISGTGYVLITDGVQATTAGNIDASYITGTIPPSAHAATHENAGADEISVAGLSGLLADGQTSLAHATSHENGGTDEINVAGLSGVLADPQTPSIPDGSVTYAKIQDVSDTGIVLGRFSPGAGPIEEGYVSTVLDLIGGAADGNMLVRIGGYWAYLTSPTVQGQVLTANVSLIPEWDASIAAAHAASHENAGGDELSVAGLSGVLADPQTPIATAAGLALLDDATAGDQRTTLGLGAMATKATVATADIDAGAVTYAKIQDVSDTDKVLGRATGGAGDVEEIVCTPAARSLIAQTTAAGQRVALGLGALAALDSVGYNEINNDSVYYVKMQAVTANMLLGRGVAGPGIPEEIPCTAAGRALLDDAAASDQRTTLGLGAMATKATVATGDIDADAVTYAKIQNVSATDRLLGRDTAAAGDAEELTVTGGVEFTGAGGIQRSALTGDVTATAGSNATTIAAGAVTYAKMQDVSATARVLGRSTVGAGDPEELKFGGAEKGADVASAGTTTIGQGVFFHITGTTTITDIDFTETWDGRMACLTFDGSLTLTYHATTLILPGKVSIQTAPGDSCWLVVDSGDNVKVVSYERADGEEFVNPRNASTAGQLVSATTAYLTDSSMAIPPSGLRLKTVFYWRLVVTKTAAGTAASSILVELGTNGSAADATILTFTLPAGTGAVDDGIIEIFATIRGPLGASCIMQGHLFMTHRLGEVTASELTGLIVKRNATILVTSGTFTSSTAGLIIGITATTGASQAWTFSQVIAESSGL